MKKRLLAIVVATIFMLNVFAFSALADTAPGVTVTPDPASTTTTTSTTAGTTNTTNTAVTTPDSGLTPVSPLYGLKVFSEKLNLLLTADPQQQAALYAQYAIERLTEAQLLTNLTDQQKADLLKNLTTEYAADIQKAQELLQQAMAGGANIQELVIKIDQAQNISGINIVLSNVPDGDKNEIQLRLLQNLQSMDAIKQLLAQKGMEIEDENENEALESILGQSMSAFVHAVNDARQEVHKAVVAKNGNKETRKDLKDIEKQFKNELKGISKTVKADLVQIAKNNTTEAQAKDALNQAVQKGIDQVKAAKEKALAAINGAVTPPDVNVTSGDGTQSMMSSNTKIKVKYDKENHKDNRKENEKANKDQRERGNEDD